jgi:hypothetical protein
MHGCMARAIILKFEIQVFEGGWCSLFLGANVIKIDNPRRNYMPFNITVYQYSITWYQKR